MRPIVTILTSFMLMATGLAQNNETILQKIEEEGINNSKVMDILETLSNIHSPRLSGTKAYYDGALWVKNTMESWNYDVALEPYEFPGSGWEASSFSVNMIAPRFEPIVAYPSAWSGSTSGVVNGVPKLVDIFDLNALKELKGQLSGRILLHSESASRLGDKERVIGQQEILKELNQNPSPEELQDSYKYVTDMVTANNTDGDMEKLMEFLRAENVGAVLMPSVWDNHVIEVSEYAFNDLKNTQAIPWLNISKEAHGKIKSMILKNAPPELNVELKAVFYDRPEYNVNIVADLKGTDPQKRDEIVLVGAHFDTWHGGANAADNNTGIAMTMEALRILDAVGVKPKRTIRTGFWGGEEQQFYGSLSYLKDHIGDIVQKKYTKEHAKISAYFNSDSGGGAIRGFFVQGNKEALSISQSWGSRFSKMGI